MAWRVCLVALLVLWSAAVAARHGTGVIDPRRATPGIRIELVELPSGASAAEKKYQLRAEGVPRGFTFDVWTQDFGQQFKEAYSGFRVEATGVLASVYGSGQPRRLEDIALGPGPYPKGAVWMVALASEDHKLSAFAKVIPHPIVARDRACSVFLELISLHGNRFLATGAGFVPGEEVDVDLLSAGRVTQRKLRVSADGRLPLDIVMHGGIGTDLSARYAVKASSCGPAIEYEWGEAAVKRR